MEPRGKGEDSEIFWKLATGQMNLAKGGSDNSPESWGQSVPTGCRWQCTKEYARRSEAGSITYPEGSPRRGVGAPILDSYHSAINKAHGEEANYTSNFTRFIQFSGKSFFCQRHIKGNSLGGKKLKCFSPGFLSFTENDEGSRSSSLPPFSFLSPSLPIHSSLLSFRLITWHMVF